MRILSLCPWDFCFSLARILFFSYFFIFGFLCVVTFDFPCLFQVLGVIEIIVGMCSHFHAHNKWIQLHVFLYTVDYFYVLVVMRIGSFFIISFSVRGGHRHRVDRNACDLDLSSNIGAQLMQCSRTQSNCTSVCIRMLLKYLLGSLVRIWLARFGDPSYTMQCIGQCHRFCSRLFSPTPMSMA